MERYARDGRVSRLSYTGIDISETAISVACLKQTEGDFINLSVDRLSLLKDQCFDAVYSSSMLEHIGFPEVAIRSMWRLAARRMEIMFYEGLSGSSENEINYHPHPEGISPREMGGYYGVKVARQQHGGAFDRPGYFLNKFSAEAVLRTANGLDGVSSVTIKDFDGRDGKRSVVSIFR